MEKKQIRIILALKNIKGYSNRKIIEIGLSRNNLERIHTEFFKNNAEYKKAFQDANVTIENCMKKKIQIVTFFDIAYPQKLKRISSPPILLFAIGNLELLKKPAISIIGTREPSKNTLEWSYQSSKEIVSRGYVIVSGGAKGVDNSAHKAALDLSGDTICVLGSGFNHIYPNENEDTIKEIIKKGLVLSERSPNSKVNRFALLERNRITSGLGDKILIVASGKRGGSMSQFKVAKSQKKEIICPDPSLQLEPTEGIKEMIIKYNIPTINIISQLFNINNENQSQLLSIYS